MRIIYIFLFCLLFQTLSAQKITSQEKLEKRISTMDFVEVLNGNLEETLFYYDKNWKTLRKRAIEKNYILSYELLQTPLTENSSVQVILITTYKNKEQYESREENFRKLIESSGGLKLLNDKKPNEFRKVVFNKEQVKHL